MITILQTQDLVIDVDIAHQGETLTPEIELEGCDNAEILFGGTYSDHAVTAGLVLHLLGMRAGGGYQTENDQHFSREAPHAQNARRDDRVVIAAHDYPSFKCLLTFDSAAGHSVVAQLTIRKLRTWKQ